MRGFLKATTSRLYEFPQVPVVNCFRGFINTVCSDYQSPVHVLLATFRNPFIAVLAAFEILFQKIGAELGEHKAAFNKIRKISKCFHRSVKKKFNEYYGKLH